MKDIIKKEDIKKFLGNFKQNKNESKDDIYLTIENAKKEWEDAKNIFENVSQPELVDYAIYNIEAAEKKYTYLLKQIKNSSTSN